MKFKQTIPYNRDCPVRWEFIKQHCVKGTSMDVGSAEGYYVRKLTEFGKVISIEGSDFVYNSQVKLNEGHTDIELLNLDFDYKQLKKMKKVKNMLLLSVLHWLEQPDEFLEVAGKKADRLFIELPDLNCKASWNQAYLKRIKEEYKTIENYLEKLTDKKIQESVTNNAKHVGGSRVVYGLWN